jgi:CRP/FNR family transcriptional regulator
MDKNIQMQLLKSQQLFEKLQKNCTQKNYKAGDIILNENAHIRSIPIVMKGTLKVIRTEED